jgi:hypothetical protein
VVQTNRMDLVADRVARKVLAGRVRLPRKADQVAKGSRADMADLVSREDLADQGVRKVGQARLPWNADQKNRVAMADCAVQTNRMDTADQVVQARKVLAAPARPPGKEVSPLPTEDLRRRSQTRRSISRSSSHGWRVPRRDVTHLCDRLSLRRTR